MGVADRLTVPHTIPTNGEDDIPLAPGGISRDTDSTLYDTDVNLADTKSALRPSASAQIDTDSSLRDARGNRVQLITVSSFGGGDEFALTAELNGQNLGDTISFTNGTDAASSDIQTALRTLLTDTCTVSGSTNAGPYTVTFLASEYARKFPKLQVASSTGCTAVVSVVQGAQELAVVAAAEFGINKLGESHRVSETDTIMRPTIGTITVNAGTDQIDSLTYEAGTNGGTYNFTYHAGISVGVSTPFGGVGGIAWNSTTAVFQAQLDAVAGTDAPTVSLYSGGEVQTIDLNDVAQNDTFKIATGAGGTAKTASITVPSLVDSGTALAALIATRLNTVLGAASVSVSATDGNTYVVTWLKPGNQVQMQVTDQSGFTCNDPDSTGVATNTAGTVAVWRFTWESGNQAGRPVVLGTLGTSSNLLTATAVATEVTWATVTPGVLGNISGAYTERGSGDSILGAAINDSTGNSYGFQVDADSAIAVSSLPPGDYHLIARTIEDGRVSKADSKAFTMTST